MKWLIVEDALRDRKGHWLEYVSTFVRGLRELGDEVVVLCDSKVEGFVMEQTGALPVLPESIWHRMADGAGAVKRYLRVPGHAIATLFAMRKVFRGFNHGLHGLTRMGKAQGDAQETCAGAAFSNPFASKLARDSENTSPTRGASAPAEEALRADDMGSGSAVGNQFADSMEFLKGQSQAGLQMDNQKLPTIRTANDPSAPGEYSSSVPIRDIRGSNFVTLDSGPSPLDSGEAPDWIFVPTVLVHHLLGWWLLLKTGSLPKESRVLLFFPNLPIRLDGAGKAHWNRGPTTKLMAWLFATLRNEVESGRVMLGVETHAMRRALEALIRMPVVYLPHPVEAAQPPRTDSGRLRTEVEDQNIDSSNNPLSAICHPPSGYAKPIVFGCYGAARWEKGSDIFQDAIKLILKNEVASDGCRVASIQSECTRELGPAFLPITSNPLPATAAGRPLRFAIQWVEDFQDEKGNLVQLDPWLKNHPQVEVIGRFFEEDEYERRLAATDVMVLPYRSPYRLRVSRVVIEAMMNGMPVIATRGTTLFEQAEEYGVVIGCEEGSAESLAEAILKAAENFEMMRVSAMQRSRTAAKSFSVGYFRDLLGRNGQKLSTLDAGPSSLHFK
ncbi:MAG: glycosyltransferase [Verrucomicrobia bacterium]|nr:glycosyltransferase [Verrucomicrobiota bacterium]